jgi:hypothetical protein
MANLVFTNNKCTTKCIYNKMVTYRISLQINLCVVYDNLTAARCNIKNFTQS